MSYQRDNVSSDFPQRDATRCFFMQRCMKGGSNEIWIDSKGTITN